jgi:hypothetical protein
MVRSISAATAQMARRAPRLGLSLAKRAANLELALRTAAQAHCTIVVLSQVPPFRIRLERRLPALSSLRGTRQAQDMNWPSLGKRLMSMPVSPNTAVVLGTPMPGTGFGFSTIERWY